MAAVEAVVFALAFTSLASSLDSPVRLVGYAVGVALGTVLGLAADERLPSGAAEVDIVVRGHDPPLVEPCVVSDGR